MNRNQTKCPCCGAPMQDSLTREQKAAQVVIGLASQRFSLLPGEITSQSRRTAVAIARGAVVAILATELGFTWQLAAKAVGRWSHKNGFRPALRIRDLCDTEPATRESYAWILEKARETLHQ